MHHTSQAIEAKLYSVCVCVSVNSVFSLSADTHCNERCALLLSHGLLCMCMGISGLMCC